MNKCIKTRQIKGNEPLLLTNPHEIWFIESGSVALFATALHNGLAEGERRFLATASAGDALFGAAPDPLPYALVAIALEPTELVTRSAADARCPMLIERWIHILSHAEGLPQAIASETGGQAQFFSLLSGQRYQPPDHQVVWLQLQRGHATWLGFSEIEIGADFGLFPVSSPLWLHAIDDVELFIQPTFAIADGLDVVEGLSHFHHLFLRGIQHLEAQETQAALLRFQARQELNRQVTQTTIRNLATVLNLSHSPSQSAETPLLIAAGAVGRALGVHIEPPMQSEDLNRVREPLEAIARASRLRLRRVLLRDRWWQRDGGPILAYTREGNQPVALLPVNKTHYELLDPARHDATHTQATTLSQQPSLRSGRIFVDEQIAKTLNPIAYVFYRPLPDGVIQAWHLLKFALQGQYQDLLAILLTGVAATVMGMLVPQATAIVIDDAIPYGNAGLLMQLGIGLLAAAFGSASFQLAQAIASMRIETVSDASLQAAVWDRLLKLKTGFFRDYSIGDLNSRVSGISAIRRKLSGAVLQTVFASFFALLNLGLLFYYSPPLATLALVVALIIVTFTAISGTLLIQKHQPLMELEGDIFGSMVQLINGVPKLRIAGVEERAFAYWGQKYTQQLQLTLSTQRIEDVVALFNTVMPTLTTVALFWLASTLIQPSQMFNAAGLSAGEFLAFNVAFGTFIGGATSLSNTLVEVLDIIPTWQRSLPILTAQPEVDLAKADPGRLTGSIQLDHVTFRYRDDGPLTLDDVTINVKPGEFIALVGPSGSGKSTVMRLLLGFETPFSGSVYYDGQDLMGLDVSAVRRQLGVVLQNSRINSGSIFENIASGALITLDDAWLAAEMSGLADDVRAMPMQMQTLISEGGGNLSGGQRQRLIIARALALHPRILLFDEATSALDNRTQAIVSQSLDQLNVTRIVIAHRLSTIRNADRIYVLEAGRIVQQGSFDELANQPGLFAQLISRQMT